RFISGHTAGLVSRKAKVRVLFVNDVISPQEVGKNASSTLQVSPAVSGSVTFVSPRELALVPSKDLEKGKYYRVSIRGQGLKDIPATLNKYEFLFQVLEQQFDVNIDGLSAQPNTDSEMMLKGAVVTADVVDADNVEKMLIPSLAGKPLKVSWQHAIDALRHD